jgi:hypothetical protein
VNNWLKYFKEIIKEKFPSFAIHNSQFTFLPSYDIDIAWSYLHKGWWRNFGGSLRSLLKGQWKKFSERRQVLGKKQQDPFDAYGWMNQLHEKYKLKPYYFFLVADQRSRYDKNIPGTAPAMKQLIHDHAVRYPIGVHPSWQSNDDVSLLKKEIDILAAITGNTVRSSRQHYIRLALPETFRRLLDQGIQFDFSMGYGGVNGFRASVATPFHWYDLEKEKQTALLLFPFCYMDANSFYEQHCSTAQALEEMYHYYRVVKEVNGIFIMIWHNSFLGTDRTFIGWREIYERFIKETSS